VGGRNNAIGEGGFGFEVEGVAFVVDFEGVFAVFVVFVEEVVGGFGEVFVLGWHFWD